MGDVNERDPAQMSDEALREACRWTEPERTWNDRVLDTRWGCAAVVAVFALLVIGGHLALRGLLGAGGWVVSAVVVGVGFVSVLLRPSEGERWRMACWGELRRRYTAVEAAARVEDLEREAAEGGPRAGAERVVVVGGVEMPGGDSWLARVWLWGEGEGVVEGRALSGPRLGRGGELSARKGQRKLTADEDERVWALVEAADVRRGVEVVLTGCKDGEPVILAFWVRGRGVVWRARCNLACVRKADRERVAVQLMEMVKGLGRGVADFRSERAG